MVEIKNLHFGYRENKQVIKCLDLNLESGHIYGLLGKNGAGKSTLLKNITGFSFPQQGACLFKGVSVSKRSVAVLEDIYFLPEDIFVPNLTPRQFEAGTGYFYPKFNQAEFYNNLKVLDVDADEVMDKQSFGQQKKAMIAFGLAAGTSLLVMDEPTNGLDIPSKVQFRKLIASILTIDRCVVIATHQVRDLDSLIDTLLVLHNGEIKINQSIDVIQEKLLFENYNDTEDLDILYEESSPKGKNVIVKNTSGEYSKIDLELLFNAIIVDNEAVLEKLISSNND
ncbi:ATP-binding cassette domain-containing protein [Mucilaginibacter sp. P25]|uniref:ATP-binding cassette domain-containing protein n=1 Tax=Mucilaginibacter sp. P25 TaxID=3423945 RepID=UPI003D7A53BD